MEEVFNCVMPYILDSDDRNAISLVSRKFYELDSLTRKRVTVHVHYAPDPERLSLRFPFLESLTLKAFKYSRLRPSRIPVTPWIKEIAADHKFKCLKALGIRKMVVSDSDLHLLADTRGGDLRTLELSYCKMASECGLISISRSCNNLRTLRLDNNKIGGDTHGRWLRELALCNTVIESFYSHYQSFEPEDVTLLAKKCSNSLVSFDISPKSLSDFENVFSHAIKLDHFGCAIIDENRDYSGFKFPPNICSLRIKGWPSIPLLFPYLNQLRELDIGFVGVKPNCQCFFFKRCPSLEVLICKDVCGDIGLQVIGTFCKKLRKFIHCEWVTHMGLIALAQGCPNLEFLKVYLLDISNEALECVGTHLKNLRDFRLWLHDEGVIIDLPLDNGVRAMLMGCSKLERLDFHLCLGGLTDVGLGFIGEYGHNLRHLSLRYTGESDTGLLELSKGCPKLTKLKLYGCPFSEQAVTTLVFNIHSLRYVWARIDSGVHLLLTRPMVSAEVLSELKPYVTLAEKLHRLAVQLLVDESHVGSIKMKYTSSSATDDLDTPLVRAMVAKGIRINEEWVMLDGSSEKPIEIIKVQIANVESRFTIAVSESGDIKLEGRVKDGVPHLTKVGAFEVDVSLEGNIILCRQVDQPNTIQSVTKILGEENVNINSMSVGRPRKQAVMVIGLDEKLSKEALKKIDDIPAVEEFVFLDLDKPVCSFFLSARGDKKSRMNDY